MSFCYSPPFILSTFKYPYNSSLQLLQLSKQCSSIPLPELLGMAIPYAQLNDEYRMAISNSWGRSCRHYKQDFLTYEFLRRTRRNGQLEAKLLVNFQAREEDDR